MRALCEMVNLRNVHAGLAQLPDKLVFVNCQLSIVNSAKPFKHQGTSKNYPFGFWLDLLPSQFVLKIPQYIQYSGISNTFVRTKSLTQNTKKQFLEVANISIRVENET